MTRGRKWVVLWLVRIGWLLIVLVGCGARSELDTPTSSSSDAGAPDAIVTPLCSPSTPVTVAQQAIVPSQFFVTPVGAPFVSNGYVEWLVAIDGDPAPWDPGEYYGIGQVDRAPIGGGSVETVATIVLRPHRDPQLAFDGEWMYWAADPHSGPGETQGTIVRASPDGSNVTTIIGGLSFPEGVVVQDGKIYFALAQTLERANVDGTNVEAIGSDTAIVQPGLSAVTSNTFYFIGSDGLESFPTSGGSDTTIVPAKVGLGGQGPMILFSGLFASGTSGLVIRAEDDLKSNSIPGTLLSWSTSSSSFSTIASGFIENSAMSWRTAVRGTTAYFTTSDVPIAGGTPTFVGPTSSTGGIAFDDTRVYWTSLDGNTVTVYSACQ